MKRILYFLVFSILITSPSFAATSPSDLPSWNDGPVKKSILSFVDNVEKANIPVTERIAVFDNDGTLWAEQPVYTEMQFVIDRIKVIGRAHPEWQTTMPYRAILQNDKVAAQKFTEQDAAKLVAATHTGMTPEEFKKSVSQWIRASRHPTLQKPYKDCVYQPMVELLNYLRDKGFKTFIVSGGGIDFMRAFAEDVYGIPPEQVIGSSGKTKFEIRNGKAMLIKLNQIQSVSDYDGKPVNINLHIGRRPLLAFGNSDGDLQMLQYTDAGERERLMLILHHDDNVREYAYDRTASVGRLDKALDEASKRRWQVVSMKRDFKTVFPTGGAPMKRGITSTLRVQAENSDQAQRSQ